MQGNISSEFQYQPPVSLREVFLPPARSFSMTKLSPYAGAAVLFMGSILLGWRALSATFALATLREEYTHILLIIPVAAALLALDWRSFKVSFSSGVKIGSLLLAAAALLGMVVHWKSLSLAPDVELSLGMIALVTWWIGSFVLCFGAVAARKELFPLVFLYWLVPWPQFLLDDIVAWLQLESAISARALFALSRTPVTLDGLSLLLPGLTLNVAPECSSIRSSLFLIVTTVIFAHLFLHSYWRKTAVLAVAILLSPLKNGLRIFTIGFLTVRVDPTYLTGRLHRDGGVVFLAIAQAVVFAALSILWRGEQRYRMRIANHPVDPG